MQQSTDTNQAIESIDRMIDEVADARESECELLREHLESARTGRLGEMTDEYHLPCTSPWKSPAASPIRSAVGA